MPARISKSREWRCRWSDEGKRKMRPANPAQTGTAWFPYQQGYVRVQWDGRKEPKTYLAEYVEPTEDATLA